MRIEIVVEAPTHDAVDSIDVISLGNEVARIVRNQISGEAVELVHAAVGPRHTIAVPADEADGPAWVFDSEDEDFQARAAADRAAFEYEDSEAAHDGDDE